MYQPITGPHCCDNCEPQLFPVEKITVVWPLCLKRGKEKAVTDTESGPIHNQLVA